MAKGTDKPGRRGRPTDYTPELGKRICEEIADNKSVREICRDVGMPDKRTVFRWLIRHDDFRHQYARAREVQADHMAEEILEIADDSSNDWMERQREKSGKTETVVDHENIQRSRLRVDARKWLMSKLQPKKYGEKPDERTADKADNTIIVKGGLPDDDTKPVTTPPAPKSDGGDGD